jgi:hypothetical protein
MLHTAFQPALSATPTIPALPTLRKSNPLTIACGTNVLVFAKLGLLLKTRHDWMDVVRMDL